MANRRLHLSRQDFTNASQDKGAQRTVTPHFSVVMSRKGVGTAVVVSKKVAKSAVGRHLLKRRVREAAAPWNSSEYALIIYTRPGAATLPYSEIVSELTPVLQQVTK